MHLMHLMQDQGRDQDPAAAPGGQSPKNRSTERTTTFTQLIWSGSTVTCRPVAADSQMTPPTTSPLGPTATAVSWPAVHGSLGVHGNILRYTYSHSHHDSHHHSHTQRDILSGGTRGGLHVKRTSWSSLHLSGGWQEVRQD